MTTEIELATLNAAVTAAATAPLDGGWNGSAGRVNLAKPRDYTGDWGKIVATQNNFNLPETLCYYMWVAQGKPDAATAVTQEHIDVAIPHFRNAIARYRAYKVFHAAGTQFVYRSGDLIDANYCAGAIKKGRATRELYTLLTAEGQMEDKVAEAGRNVLLSIVANAIHREQNADHSWFTKEMENKRSPTSKTITIAGADKDTFRAYMKEHGHDGNHHLDFTTIDTLAKVLSRHSDLAIPDGAAYNIGADNIAGKNIGEYFDLGEAVRGRYPAGVLGKAAIIIGLQMIEAMIVNLASRVKIDNVSGISSNATALQEQIAGTNLTHKVILEIGRVLGPTISTVYGFCITAKVVNEEQYKAFENHAIRYPAKLAIGKSIAKTLARTMPHKEAIQTSIIASLSAMSAALVAAAAVKSTDADGAPPICGSLVAVDTSKIKAEVGKTGTGGGGGGTMFFDAVEG